jgi:S1-C subfamily serine protease
MHDEESGSGQQGGWQPPEYVSPWLPSSGSADDNAQGGGDTISFGSGPGYEAGQDAPDGPVYGPAQGHGAPGAPSAPGQGPGYGQAGRYGPGPAVPGYDAGGYSGGPAASAGPGYGGPPHGAPGYNGPSYGAAGYGGANYGSAGYGGANYGGPGFGSPGYGGPGYGQDPWGGYGAPPPPPRSGFSRTLAYLAVAVLAAGAGAGAAVALNHNSGASAAIGPSTGTGNSGTGNGGIGNGGTGNGGTGNGNGFGSLPPSTGNSGNSGNSGGTNANAGVGPLNATKLAAKVDPGLVDVTSDLKYSDSTAEGTGMVITANGLVLTNNHVIDQSTSVSAQLVVSGKTYTARVIGYDSADDVALLQLIGASGLKTVSLGNSATLKVREAVLALGNAGGRGGLPSTAQGTVQALNQSIQASDEGAGTTENLHGMVQTNAPIQQGDSGGPLVNGSGQVVGMDTAANSSESGQGTAATEGFAIPINKAISIADEIANGKASTTVHLGLAGFMGVNVANADNPSDCGTGGGDGFGGLGGYAPAVNSGALICDVYPGAPAAASGLTGGDVITSVNGSTVSTANGLTRLMSGSKPGSQLSLVYVDENGARHTTTVTLTGWAK